MSKNCKAIYRYSWNVNTWFIIKDYTPYINTGVKAYEDLCLILKKST